MKTVYWNLKTSPGQETREQKKSLGLEYVKKLKKENEKVIEVKEENDRLVILLEDN